MIYGLTPAARDQTAILQRDFEKAGWRVVYTAGIDPAELEQWRFDNFLVQPMDCERREEAMEAAVSLAMERPRWRLSLQAHKVVGLR